MMPGGLNIFVPHCSDVLTDHLPHGDGLIAHGFMTSLAQRGHRLHVAAERVELRQPMHANITIHPIALKRPFGLRSRLQYMLQVRKLMRNLRLSQRFDLVHQLNPVFTGVSLCLADSDLPLVLGTYVARWPVDPDALSVTRGWGAMVERSRDRIAAAQQRRADALMLTTPAARNQLSDPEAVQDRIHMIPHGIDAQLFSPLPGWDSSERLEVEQRQPSILFLANVVKRKGIFTLLTAFPEVLRHFPQCQLRVAGGGPDLPEARHLATRLGCAHRVEFMGNQDRAHAPNLYRACSVYCLPSFGEPYGTTVVEAMGCARSLVVTDCGALPYLVHKGGGMRVPAGEPAALSTALITLLRNPQARAAMGAYNRKQVDPGMSWNTVAQQLEGIYQTVLSQRKSRLLRHHNTSPAFWRSAGSAPKPELGS
jgi:glycosyltransferase involved in cell wall biosynthesis